MATPDWEAIETAYCAGVLPFREIAELYGDGITEGAIRKRAAKLGWVRNKKGSTQKGTQVRKKITCVPLKAPLNLAMAKSAQKGRPNIPRKRNRFADRVPHHPLTHFSTATSSR